MQEKDKNSYSLIISLAHRFRLKEALTQLDVFMANVNRWELKEQKENMDRTYQYMMEYMKEGLPDAGRQKVVLDLRSGIIELANLVKLQREEETTDRLFFRQKKDWEKNRRSMTGIVKELEDAEDDFAMSTLMTMDKRLEILRRREKLLKELFTEVWCSSLWTENDRKVAMGVIIDKELRMQDKALLVSAVFMSLMMLTDNIKMHFLMDVYADGQPKLKQRALIGLVFKFNNDKEIQNIYRDLGSRWETMKDEALRKEVREVYLEYLMCTETEKVNQKMRNELLPDIINSVKTKMKDMDINKLSKWDEDMEGMNPEWEKLINDQNPEFNAYMEQFNDLQKEGADIYMSNFSMLKSGAFFREIQNWFYPFDMQMSLFFEAYQKGMKDMKEFLEGSGLCDNDKFSLMTVMQDSGIGKQMMSPKPFIEIPEEIQEQLKEMEKKNKFICREYLQDLYRFYKLFIYRSEFKDIFKTKAELHELEVMKNLLDDELTLKMVAQFYLRHERWEEALEIFGQLEKKYPNEQRSADYYQQKGFVLQKSNEIEKALEAYQTADTICPNNLWTIRNMAICYRKLKDYVHALEFYRQVEAVKPDNKSTILNLAYCLSELKRFDEAMNYFFKLDFMEEGNLKANRGIAWCSFMLGKYEQANEYYDRILKQKPEVEDFLNAGHTAWVAGHFKEAVNLYRQCHERLTCHSDFCNMLRSDLKILVQKGIAEEEIWLMADIMVEE